MVTVAALCLLWPPMLAYLLLWDLPRERGWW